MILSLLLFLVSFTLPYTDLCHRKYPYIIPLMELRIDLLPSSLWKPSSFVLWATVDVCLGFS